MKILPPAHASSDFRNASGKMRCLTGGIVATALLLVCGLAEAADTVCTTPLPVAGSPYGNLIVPAGESCVLDGVRVNGNVTVFGNLYVNAGATDTTIRGNINTRDGCFAVRLVTLPGSGSGRVIVGGGVNIEHCFGGSIGNPLADIPPPSPVCDAPLAADCIQSGPRVLIGNNLKCSNNSANCFVGDAVVGGNVELSGNVQGATAIASLIGGNMTVNNNGFAPSLFENGVGGDLKCAGNVGGVTGGLNTVAGLQQGQCAGL
jgi:hypothetical protein